MLRGRLTSLRRAPVNYGVAVALTLVAFALRFILNPLLEQRSPYLVFVFAVTLSAVYCGPGPAVVAMFFSLVLSVYFFIEPVYRFFPLKEAEIVQALMFLVPSAFIIVLAQVAERDREVTRRASDRFRLLTEQAREYAVITTDAQGSILTWSNGAKHLFRYQTREVLGQSMQIIFTDEDRKRAIPEGQIRQAIQEGHAPCERWLARRDGSTFYGMGILVPLRDSEGKIIELAMILRDETHLKKREEQLTRRAQKSESALAETTQQIDAFTYTVAHDLRAPLRAMDGFAKALQDEFQENLGPQGREYIHRILGAAHRMDELVSDLLEFSGLARLRERCVAIDSNAVLDRAIEDLTPDIAANRGHVEREAPLPPVCGHPTYLYKAFYHLLGNALKFHREDLRPEVKIGCERRDGFVRIYFRDNGVGIAPEHHRRIFRVFERINKQVPGTGIGLSIVHKCAELMHGHVSVDSKPGEGSCFWLELPAADEQTKQEPN